MPLPRRVSPLAFDVLGTPGRPLDGSLAAALEGRFRRDFSQVRARGPASLRLGEGLHSQQANPDERIADRMAAEVVRTPQDSAPVSDASVAPAFAGVRVHTGPLAAQAAVSINARAYTVGRSIVFGQDQYAPHTPSGHALLTHELAHIWQERGRSEPGRIRRYEGPEHQDLGDENLEELFAYVQTPQGLQWAKGHGLDPAQLLARLAADPQRRGVKIIVRPGLALTPGQIISLMGDFYQTWQDFQSAPKTEIDQILTVMQKERSGGIDANKEYENITKGRYTKLAKVNTAHFAPKNKVAWEYLHREAIHKAQRAGTDKDENAFQDALFIDAAGGHFLTDAFAAGHLFDSVKVEAAIRVHLQTKPIRADNPEMQTLLSGMQFVGLASSLVLKNIHDWMNAQGFDVTNAKGDTWKTYGDNHLKNAAETRRIAAYAVFVSREQITRAKAGENPDLDEVLDLLPDARTVEKATNYAYGRIPTAVKEVTPLINRNIGMLDTIHPPWYALGPAFPHMLKSVVKTISDPARSKTLDDYERRRAIDPMTPYPTPPLLRFDF